MFNLFIFLIFTFISTTSFANNKSDYSLVDFDESMGFSSPHEYHRLFIKSYGKKRMDFFRDLYNKNRPDKKKYSPIPLIPKIIHQVWVGGAIPAIYQYYQKTCKELHPDWKYILWTDKEIDALSFENRDLYDSARNYSEKSDILRNQLLKDFGGVYIDIDIKCIKPLDALHHLYEAYFGLEFPISNWHSPTIAPGIMASKPGHKIITNILEKIRKDWDIIEEKFDKGIINTNNKKIIHNLAIERSMRPVTESFVEMTKIEDNVIALPATYFYPIKYFSIENLINPIEKRMKNHFFKLIAKFFNMESSSTLSNWVLNKVEDDKVFRSIKKESFCYHDYFSADSTMRFVSFIDGFGLYDKQIKEIFKKNTSNKDQIRFEVFKQLYDMNHPHGKAKFNQNDKNNYEIHFINLVEDSNFNKSVDSFKMFNKNAKVTIWDENKIRYNFPDVMSKVMFFQTQTEKEFYIAMNILLKHGGLYINGRNLKAIQTIDELNNKFDFYAGLMPINTNNFEVKIDLNFIASKPNHLIVKKALQNIEENILNKNVSIESLVTTNIYKYLALGGKNIILPPLYFHPIAKLEQETLLSKIKRFYFGYERAFSKVNEYISISENIVD